MTIQEAQKVYLNKRVRVTNIINTSVIIGKCDYIGMNEILNSKFQITINRMSITLNSLQQVSLIE